MAVSKKGTKEEFVREIFLALAARWDVKDRHSSQALARHCIEIADGYYDVMEQAFAAKKPEKPA